MAVKMSGLKKAGKPSGPAKPAWAKTGKAAKQTIEKEEALAEQKQAQQGKLRRFWMPKNAETQLTFLDGDLDADGVLETLVYYEHNVFMNGNWRNWFVCTQDQEPCPVCEGGDEAALVGVFTVIEHPEFEYKDKVYKNQRRLFVAKRGTLKILQKIAAKRGGLAGCTFDVSRSGEKSPGVGDMFDFTEKRTVLELKKAFPDVENWEAADYAEEITYRDAKELRAMGFGTSVAVGTESGVSDDEVDDEL